jgi:hypothetical protein
LVQEYAGFLDRVRAECLSGGAVDDGRLWWLLLQVVDGAVRISTDVSTIKLLEASQDSGGFREYLGCRVGMLSSYLFIMHLVQARYLTALMSGLFAKVEMRVSSLCQSVWLLVPQENIVDFTADKRFVGTVPYLLKWTSTSCSSVSFKCASYTVSSLGEVDGLTKCLRVIQQLIRVSADSTPTCLLCKTPTLSRSDTLRESIILMIDETARLTYSIVGNDTLNLRYYQAVCEALLPLYVDASEDAYVLSKHVYDCVSYIKKIPDTGCKSFSVIPKVMVLAMCIISTQYKLCSVEAAKCKNWLTWAIFSLTQSPLVSDSDSLSLAFHYLCSETRRNLSEVFSSRKEEICQEAGLPVPSIQSLPELLTNIYLEFKDALSVTLSNNPIRSSVWADVEKEIMLWNTARVTPEFNCRTILTNSSRVAMLCSTHQAYLILVSCRGHVGDTNKLPELLVPSSSSRSLTQYTNRHVSVCAGWIAAVTFVSSANSSPSTVSLKQLIEAARSVYTGSVPSDPDYQDYPQPSSRASVLAVFDGRTCSQQFSWLLCGMFSAMVMTLATINRGRIHLSWLQTVKQELIKTVGDALNEEVFERILVEYMHFPASVVRECLQMLTSDK